MSQKTFVLFNPASGRGRGQRRLEHYLPLLEQHLPGFDHVVTQYAGHETELFDRALADGYTDIVAVGGDGTWSAAADRIVKSGREGVTLGLLPAGTGNDFGKSLGIRFERSEEIVRAIAAGKRRTIDVGRVDGRYFINVVGLGFDIAVIDDAEHTPILKGDVLYRFCALKQLFRFPGISLGLRGEDSDTLRKSYLMLIIANANYFGGSFHIAPGASLEDGKLDAVSIFNVGPLARARLFSLVSKGKHEAEDQVDIRQSRRFTIDFEGVADVRYEVDGEVFNVEDGALEVESVPAALTVFAPD